MAGGQRAGRGRTRLDRAGACRISAEVRLADAPDRFLLALGRADPAPRLARDHAPLGPDGRLLALLPSTIYTRGLEGMAHADGERQRNGDLLRGDGTGRSARLLARIRRRLPVVGRPGTLLLAPLQGRRLQPSGLPSVERAEGGERLFPGSARRRSPWPREASEPRVDPPGRLLDGRQRGAGLHARESRARP